VLLCKLVSVNSSTMCLQCRLRTAVAQHVAQLGQHVDVLCSLQSRNACVAHSALRSRTLTGHLVCSKHTLR
jgi:GTP cyclohydrolase I